MNFLDGYTPNQLFTFINWVDIVEDIINLIPAFFMLIYVIKGPCFVIRGLVLVIAACLFDILYQVASIAYEHPPVILQGFLYSLTGVNNYLDVMIFWTIAYMYWITALNIQEINVLRNISYSQISISDTTTNSNSKEQIRETASFNKKPVVYVIYLVILLLIVVIYVASMIIDNPAAGPNDYMEFIHKTKSSRIYVIYETAILIMRIIYTLLFAYALQIMYKSLAFEAQNEKKLIKKAPFYVHMCVMVAYTISRCLNVYSYY